MSKEKTNGIDGRNVVYSSCYRLLDWYGREVNRMEYIASLIATVVGGVICHYIIKWLDGDK
jgi:hypothetical protein